jgi:uncharacterized protein YukE
MSRMVGADPDALDRLAADFDRSAGALESTAVRVRASVHANPWAGAKATRFRNDWDQRHGPMLKRTALALRTAAKQLRLQAQEQRQASSAGGGGIGGSVPSSGAGPRGNPWPDRLDAAVSSMMTGFGIGRDLAESIVTELDRRLQATGLTEATRGQILDSRLAKVIQIGGKGLTLLGALQSASDLVGGGQEGDAAKQLRGFLGAAGGVAGLVSGPAGLVIGTSAAYGDLMLATDAEEISAVQDRTMRSRFGDGVQEPYTPEQADWLVKRYEGVGGYFNSISDQVDHGMRWMNDPIEDAAKSFGDWRHQQGWW